MKFLAEIIEDARRDSDNVDYSDTTGLSDSDFVRWANDAQQRLAAKILQVKPDVFQKTKVIAGVSRQERYDWPLDMYLGTRVDNVEYSLTGLEADYDDLDEMQLRERSAGEYGHPVGFVRQSEEFLSVPIPASTGSFRVTYQKRLPKLALPATTLSAVTPGNPITAQLTAANVTEDMVAAITAAGFVTIVDALTGEVKARDCQINTCSDSGLITFATGYALGTDETMAVGNMVVPGRFHSHCTQLPEECDRYYTCYMVWKAIKRDSSNDSTEADAERKEMETEIVDSYRMPDNTLSQITILDDSNFD